MTPIEKLTHELAKLPSIGRKSALRLAIHIVRQPSEFAKSLSHSIQDAIEKVRFCEVCFHLTDINPCLICSDSSRGTGLVCIVEESSDLMAIERTGNFRGRYHVLQGSLSPLDGIGPEELKIQDLLGRIKNENIEEIILATNPNVTGDATALYISKLVHPAGIRVTKLAAGIPVGSEIEYIDQVTLGRAVDARVDFLMK